MAYPDGELLILRAELKTSRRQAAAPSALASLLAAGHSSRIRVGGGDRFQCGSADDLQFAGTVHYLDLVSPRRIVYSEVISNAETRLAASLVTWELIATGEGTRLIVTDQIASFVGQAMVDGSRTGMSAAPDNLVAAAEAEPRSPAWLARAVDGLWASRLKNIGLSQFIGG